MSKPAFRSAVTGLAICTLLSLLSMTALAGPGDTVKVGLRYDLSTVNTFELRNGNDIAVVSLMHQPLLAPHPVTGDRIGILAKSFEILENGKKIRVILYQGARFHTGDPVTAHDVKFTYEACANPANAHMLAGPLDEIEEIEVVDDHTLIFHFYESYAPWEELMWLGGMALVMPISWLADHIDRMGLLVLFVFLTAVGLLLMPWLIRIPVVSGVYAFVFGGVEGMIYALGVILVGQKFKGAVLAAATTMFTACWGAGTIMGPLLVGIGMDRFGADKMALIISVFFIAFLPMPLVSYLRSRRPFTRA